MSVNQVKKRVKSITTNRALSFMKSQGTTLWSEMTQMKSSWFLTNTMQSGSTTYSRNMSLQLRPLNYLLAKNNPNLFFTQILENNKILFLPFFHIIPNQPIITTKVFELIQQNGLVIVGVDPYKFFNKDLIQHDTPIDFGYFYLKHKGHMLLPFWSCELTKGALAKWGTQWEHIELTISFNE